MRSSDTLYLVPDEELIAAARTAAIELLLPAIQRRQRRAGWEHTYTIPNGSIVSERHPNPKEASNG
jgi:hypothetical protein